MADANVRSINLVKVATETPEEPTETSRNEEVSPDPNIRSEVVCDDGTTTSQSSQDC